MKEKNNHRRARLELVFPSVVLGLVFLALAPAAEAQEKKSHSDKLQEALGVLKKAQERKGSGLDSRARALLENKALEERAREAIANIDKKSPDDEARKNFERAAARLDAAKGNLTEEGVRRLAAETTGREIAIPVQAPAPTEEAPRSGIPSEVASAPDPKPHKPRSLEPKKKKEATVITTGPTGTGLFDGNKKIAVFADADNGVRLENPQITVDCEELEVHFKETPPEPEAEEAAVAGDGADGAAAAAAAAAAAGDAEVEAAAKEAAGDVTGLGAQSNSIEVAYARGKKVILQKKTPDGKVQIGQCREAIFDGETGDLVLKIWPQVQDGNNMAIAEEEGAIITIKRDGRLTFKGKIKTQVAND